MSTKEHNQTNTIVNDDIINNTNVNDLYSLYKKNIQKYFENIRKNYPQYFQTLTNFQQECVKTEEKTFSAMIMMQQEFAKKCNMNVNISQDMKNSLNAGIIQMIQTSDINAKIRKTILDMMTVNLKAFNNNLDLFVNSRSVKNN